MERCFANISEEWLNTMNTPDHNTNITFDEDNVVVNNDIIEICGRIDKKIAEDLVNIESPPTDTIEQQNPIESTRFFTATSS